jgi:hypothetical protein
MKERIKFSAKVTGITILFCIAALFVMGIGIAITGKGPATFEEYLHEVFWSQTEKR